MKHLSFAVAVVALVAAFTIPGDAHHSLAAAFRLADMDTIEGTIVQIAFREPHSFVQVEAPDADGVMRRWSAQWTDDTDLSAHARMHDALRPGDVVRIVGHPARNLEAYQLLIVRIARSDER